jgi:PIN domain nuclease of toxin-antitoxin system
MAFLVDSHVLFWTLAKPALLGKRAKQIIELESEIFFSSISLAEFKIKAMLGKVSFPDSIYESIVDNDFVELPFLSQHALEMGRFGSLVKHEPFDRMILAQASHERLRLLTADKVLLELGLDFVVDATL